MEAKYGINNAPTFGGTGIARGSSGIIGRSGQLVPFPRTATIVPNRLNHIIQEHTTGIRGKGQFASGANPSAIQGLINTTLSRGVIKPNTAGRTSAVYEYDFGYTIGTRGWGGKPSTSLRVIVDEYGYVITAFPF